MSYSQQGWYRLNREQSNGVLSKLGNHRDAIVFSKEATEVCWRPLEFYDRFKVFRLVNYATMPTFSMYYLSNDEEFITVDGTANPIYTVNDKAPVKLTESNVVSYLEFFFKNVQGSEGEVILIKDNKRLPFADVLNDKQRVTLFKGFKPIEIKSEGNRGFKVQATMYYGSAIIISQIQVGLNGQLAFLEQNLLMTGIHLPDTIYDQQASVEG